MYEAVSEIPYLTFRVNVIPLPEEIATYFAYNNAGADIGSALVACFNFIAINTTDRSFYDDIASTYEDSGPDELEVLSNIYANLADYLFDYIYFRPEYHFIFFMYTHDVNVEVGYIDILAELDEGAVDMYIRCPSEWRYIRAAQFGIIR